MQRPLIDWMSGIAALVALFVSFSIFYSETQLVLGSFAAALLTASLTWVSYVLVRWLVFALKK